jgi:hypothetical protein
MRPFPRFASALAVFLFLAPSTSAAAFCRALPKWAEAPCSLGFRLTSGWFGENSRKKEKNQVGGRRDGVENIWLPEGPGMDPDGRRSPPPPPAPATAPPGPESDTH